MNGVGIDGAAPGSLRRLLSWPQLRPVSTLLKPDPFDEEERDKILAYFYEDAFFFTTHHGNPIDQERFVDKHWRRVFAATGVRPRKFYATRHTSISIALTKGANLKWLATYCGTSIEMIERHYSKWPGHDDGELALP